MWESEKGRVMSVSMEMSFSGFGRYEFSLRQERKHYYCSTVLTRVQYSKVRAYAWHHVTMTCCDVACEANLATTTFLRKQECSFVGLHTLLFPSTQKLNTKI